MRLAILRFWYEGNAFSLVPATREAFAIREWYSGEAARSYYAGKGVETGAAVDFLREHPDIEGHFIHCAAAYPAGPIEAGLFGELLDRITARLAGTIWDGVYVSLHGASLCADLETPELAMLRTIRACVGDAPVAASFDLHANHSPELATLADIVVGYKTHPHIDMYATGAKALRLLHRAMRGEIRPATTIVPVGCAPTSFNMQTASGPMQRLVQLAARTEYAHDLFDVTVFGGFVYADTADTGASVTVCAERGMAIATQAAEEIAAAFRRAAPEFDIRLPDPVPILTALRDTPPAASVAVLEPSDNPFSGGAGDTPGLLRAVLDTVPDLPAIFAFFWDPELVERAHHAGVGATIPCAFGGRLSDRFGPPVVADASIERLTDGHFDNDGPMEKGLAVNLGDTALLRVGAVAVIVTARNVPVNDPAYFRLHGIDLDACPVVYAKAKNHFRAAFGDHFGRIVDVETPGPAPSDVRVLHFKSLPRERLPGYMTT